MNTNNVQGNPTDGTTKLGPHDTNNKFQFRESSAITSSNPTTLLSTQPDHSQNTFRSPFSSPLTILKGPKRLDDSALLMPSFSSNSSTAIFTPSDEIVRHNNSFDPSFATYTFPTENLSNRHVVGAYFEEEDGEIDCGEGATEHTGRWTRKEHELFLEALNKYGKVELFCMCLCLRETYSILLSRNGKK